MEGFDEKIWEAKPALRYAPYARGVWERLAEIPRAGWVRRGIEDPETVLDHTLALRQFVHDNRYELQQYFSDGEVEEIIGMLEVHDWPEVYTGDITPHDDGYEDRFEGEYVVMQNICRPLGVVGKEIFSLWERFETGEDEAASFARQVDRLQGIVRAFRYEYEGQGTVGMTRDFINYSGRLITHPFLVIRLQWVQQAYTEWRKDQ